MNPRHLFGAALAGLAGFVAVLSACANSELVAGSEVTVSPPSTSFTNVDAATPITPPPDAGMCNAYACPTPYATCPGTSGLCTTNLDSDDQHCGDCDVVCPNSLAIRRTLHASFLCAKGRCLMACTEGTGDCNKLVEDGCETVLDSDPQNCGACGVACAAGQICWHGACGCPSGYAQCGDACAKLDDDDLNCGKCGNTCTEPPPNAGLGVWPCGPGIYPENTAQNCAASKCGLHCAPGFANCNKDACKDGCEVDLQTDAENCGACGNACKPGQICAQGKCLCDDDKTRCGTSCVDLQNDADNCGACGNACPGRVGDDRSGHGTPVCELGRCTYRCAAGYADCDHRIDNGCEVDLMTDPLHCGACGASCDVAGGQPCAAGRCLTGPCDAGVTR